MWGKKNPTNYRSGLNTYLKYQDIVKKLLFKYVCDCFPLAVYYPTCFFFREYFLLCTVFLGYSSLPSTMEDRWVSPPIEAMQAGA